MAFSNDDIIKLAGSVLSAGVIDSNSSSSWYEKRTANSFIVDPSTVWSDLPFLQDYPAANFAEAVQNSVDHPEYIDRIGINDDGTFNDATALRLTPIAGTNNASYIAYNTYNDPSSGIQKSWIMPQLIPRSNGAPSAAYQATIWIGPPSNGNALLSSTGHDGNWVSHFWNAAGGLLLFAPDVAPPSAVISSADLYVTGFVYSGQTASGGGFTGNTVLLEDPDGKWRITTATTDSALMSFDRYDKDEDGNYSWKTHAHIGSSMTTDKLVLTEPHGIVVDKTKGILDDKSLDPDPHSVFTVTHEGDFVYGDNETQTVIQTVRGGDVERAASLQDVKDIEVYPVKDETFIFDTLTATLDTDRVNRLEWYSGVNYNQDIEYIQFIKGTFDIISCVDDTSTEVGCPIRFFVKDLSGNLLLENISTESLSAGVNAGSRVKQGVSEVGINPHYTAKNGAVFILGMEIPDGYKVEFKSGSYNLKDPTDGITDITQTRPWMTFCVEYLDNVAILDESNAVDKIHKNTGIILDNGVHTYVEGYDDQPVQVVGIGEHVDSVAPVLGNYLGETYVATGSGGLFVLFQDDTTRTQFSTEGDIGRLQDNATPDYFIETKEFTLDLEGVFKTEMTNNGWEVCNLEKILPLIRYEGTAVQGYRVSIISTLVPDYRFQENQTQFEFEDGKITDRHKILPTIDAVDPEYKELYLPRKAFTVNEETPRYVKFQFQEPIKLYGYYKDPTDVNDPVNTGTFVPSIKCEVLKVFEEPVVVGSDLEDRIDSLEGAQEWEEATVRNLATLHVVPSLQVLADEDGEWLLWSDEDSLFTSQDEHQWIFATGQEAYYEPTPSQATMSSDYATINPLVVHVPDDDVQGFEVSFAWHADWEDSTYKNIDYIVMVIFVNSHSRGFDSRLELNIPRNASINWRFRQRRTGEYSYIATPMNDNLASTGLGTGSDLTGTYPEMTDPNPPIDG